ncbi:MAG: hypothetical protein ACYTGS_07670 [Planctomycetota bacterium]|jgi:hypothetical protein
MDENRNSTSNRATRIFASTLGSIVGLAGVEHGILEVLQGNVRPDGIMVDAIGPEQKLWELATETVLTIIPSMLISGILSIILGGLVTIWAYKYVDRKYGSIILLILSVALFLVGGGFAPIFLTILAFIAATRINQPLRFWRSRAPATLRNLMVKLWPWTLIVSVVSFVIAVEIAIFGEPLLGLVGAETAYAIQFFLGLSMLILAILSLPAANAHDAELFADQTR